MLYINDIHSYLKDKKLEELHYNSMLFDAVCMKLFQIGEFSVKWKDIKGFRNILAHEYLYVRTYIIINILKTDLKVLEEVLRKYDTT